MVLVHGLGSSHAHWLGVTKRLARRHRVVVPDLPGFGRSPLAGRDTGLHANAALLWRIVESLDRPVVLVGNSMGALLSMLVASEHRDEVSALVLVAPPAPRPLTAPMDARLALLFASYSVPLVGELTRGLWVRMHGPGGMVRSIFETTVSKPAAVPDDVHEAALELAHERWVHDDDVHAFLRAYRSTSRFLLDGRRYDTLVRSIETPALVMHGTKDRLVSRALVSRLEKLRPDWTFAALDGLGHMPHVEDASGFVRLVHAWLPRPHPGVRRAAQPRVALTA
jgi:pimeloyl-ACP methyl ester carboxylesterase